MTAKLLHLLLASVLQLLVLRLSRRLFEVDSAAAELDLTTRLKEENKVSSHASENTMANSEVASEIQASPYLKDWSSLLLFLAAVGGAAPSVLSTSELWMDGKKKQLFRKGCVTPLMPLREANPAALVLHYSTGSIKRVEWRKGNLT